MLTHNQTFKCLYIGLFFPINIADILKYIVSIVENWEILGTQLSIPHHILVEIRANNPHNIVACKEQMISRWIDSESLTTPCCWWSLVKAAKDMDENVIVQRIKTNHSKCFIPIINIHDYQWLPQQSMMHTWLYPLWMLDQNSYYSMHAHNNTFLR